MMIIQLNMFTIISRVVRPLFRSGLHQSYRHASASARLRVFNSLTKQKEPVFQSETAISTGTLSWYQCGPTVYDSAHLGHARTYVSFDVLSRILSDYCRIPVNMAMGITDIDDKIVDRASRVGVDFRVWARHFESDFLNDLRALDVRPASMYLRVSEHLDEIVKFISQLESNGMAYRGKQTGSCYFDSAAFSRAGNIPHKLRESLRNPSAVEDSEHDSSSSGEKKSPQDFALWKVRRASNWKPITATNESCEWQDVSADPVWPSPWGWGRPGWHIECSAQIQCESHIWFCIISFISFAFCFVQFCIRGCIRFAQRGN
jgi:cysteinyl-tRNA synthetase